MLRLTVPGLRSTYGAAPPRPYPLGSPWVCLGMRTSSTIGLTLASFVRRMPSMPVELALACIASCSPHTSVPMRLSRPQTILSGGRACPPHAVQHPWRVEQPA
jgi:hypothetical protein